LSAETKLTSLAARCQLTGYLMAPEYLMYCVRFEDFGANHDAWYNFEELEEGGNDDLVHAVSSVV
jgi:hypothetical protein